MAKGKRKQQRETRTIDELVEERKTEMLVERQQMLEELLDSHDDLVCIILYISTTQ